MTGRLPVLTIAQREDVKAVVLKRRALNRELAAVFAEMRALREKAESIRAQRDMLPTNIEMAARVGVHPRHFTKVVNHAYRNQNPLDAMRQGQGA